MMIVEKVDRWLWLFWDNDEPVCLSSPKRHSYPADTLELAGRMPIADGALSRNSG